MERHHLQAIQQLQLELALYKDSSKASHEKSDLSQMQSKTNINNINVNGGSVISNGNVDGSTKVCTSQHFVIF